MPDLFNYERSRYQEPYDAIDNGIMESSKYGVTLWTLGTRGREAGSDRHLRSVPGTSSN